MIQLNLLPDVKKEYLKSSHLKNSIILLALAISGFFIALVVILVMTVFGVQKVHINNLSDDIEKDIATLQGIDDLDKVLTVQNQISAITKLHDDSPQANRIYGYLSIATPKAIKLVEIEVSTDEGDNPEKIEVSGKTATLKEVNRYADIFKNATYRATDENGDEVKISAFKTVILDSNSIDTAEENPNEKTDFTLVLVYDPLIFDPTHRNVNFSVPSIESSVSSKEKPKFELTGGTNDQPINPNPFDDGGSQ